MSIVNVANEDLNLLVELESDLHACAGPAMAFTLMMQRQALRDRISFQRWLQDNECLSEEITERNARATAVAQLSRRAAMRLGSF